MEREDSPMNGDKPTKGRAVIDKSGKCGQVDLAYFVEEVERFNRLTEPFALAFYALEDIRRWRYPTLTLVAWIVLNLACFILSKGATFVLVSLLVIGIAALSLVQLHTRILDKFLPQTTLDEDLEEDNIDEDVTLRTVQQFRYGVIQMYEFIVKCNEYLAHLYGILKWDDLRYSLKFHVEVCAFLLCLIVLPTRGICIVIVNWFFLASEDMMNVILTQGLHLYNNFTGSSVQLPLSMGDNSTYQQTPQSKAEPMDESGKGDNYIQKDDPDSVDEDSGNILLEEGVPANTGKPGMVARFREIKRKRQHIANESCFKCQTSFSSILKRRYYCRHCGNHFCSKCCNQKVSKSMFGATSPAAQTETVLVCTVCHDLLTNPPADKKS